MDQTSDKIVFETENGPEEFHVLDQTRLNGKDYLLAAVSEDPDSEVVIFRDDSASDDPEALYVPVEDEVEQDAVLRIFEEILADTDNDSDGDQKPDPGQE
ncbi:MAG: DUF1292 domain-containing protein [Lachnospiraceae bacterium]|jgi:uncharacterized protein YrzB (UPF0473 family)